MVFDEAHRLGHRPEAAQGRGRRVHDAARRVRVVGQQGGDLFRLVHLLDDFGGLVGLQFAQQVGRHVRLHLVEHVGQRLDVQVLGDVGHFVFVKLLEDVGQFGRLQPVDDGRLLLRVQLGQDLGAVGRVQGAQILDGAVEIAVLKERMHAFQRVVELNWIDHATPHCFANMNVESARRANPARTRAAPHCVPALRPHRDD